MKNTLSLSPKSKPKPAIEGGASTGAITLGDGIILYAADDKIDFDNYDNPPVVGPQTILAPANRYVIIKENEENE